MKLRQWEIWKAKPAGFEAAHFFVLASSQETLDSPHSLEVNALAWYTLRGAPEKVDVRLDEGDGLDRPTVCACDFFFTIDKTELQASRGIVSCERQQQLKAKLKEVFRLY